MSSENTVKRAKYGGHKPSKKRVHWRKKLKRRQKNVLIDIPASSAIITQDKDDNILDPLSIKVEDTSHHDDILIDTSQTENADNTHKENGTDLKILGNGNKGMGMWSESKVLFMVTEFQKRPELWDSKHEHFRNFPKKMERWKEIAKLCDYEANPIRNAINSILETLRRERRVVRAGGRSEWVLYPHLSFLPGHVEMPQPEPTAATNSSRSKALPVRKMPRRKAEASTSSNSSVKNNSKSLKVSNNTSKPGEGNLVETIRPSEEYQEELIVMEQPIPNCTITYS